MLDCLPYRVPAQLYVMTGQLKMLFFRRYNLCLLTLSYEGHIRIYLSKVLIHFCHVVSTFRYK